MVSNVGVALSRLPHLGLLLTLCITGCNSCQETYITAEDGGVVVGRTMEFGIPFKTYVVTEPPGTPFVGHSLPNCEKTMAFETAFGAIKTQGWVGDIFLESSFGGINSAGLSASLLYFPIFAEYRDKNSIKGDECLNSISQNQVVDYILSKYQTVLQLQVDLENDDFPSVWGIVTIGLLHPLHYSIIDKNGDAIVLEYTKGKGRLFFNNTVGVMTNSPPYDWHMNNLRNYPHLTNIDHKAFSYKYRGEEMLLFLGSGSGLLGMPGDYLSPSRFIRAATFLKLIKKPKTTEEAITQTMHIVNTADMMRGVAVNPGNTYTGKDDTLDHSQHTYWPFVKDLKSGCCYFRGYVDTSWRRLCITDIPDYKAYVAVEGEFENSYRDVSEDLLQFED